VCSSDLLFINAFASGNGRYELNTHINTRVSNKWSTGFYIHGNTRNQKFDKNNDTFLDAPLMKQINVLNRWQFVDLEKGLVSFINFRILNDEKQTGQVNFNPDTDKLTTNAWGSEIKTKRIEASGKLSYSNPDIPYRSINTQVAISRHHQDSYFGLNIYNITHDSFYATSIYGSIIGDSRHKFKSGFNYTYDSYEENIVSKNDSNDYIRTENSVGAFFEYNYDNLDKLNLTAGVRVDAHNLLGTFVTPRIHARYTPWENSAIKTSIGRGKRSANIFSENQQIFTTSRTISS
jgi:hypothetical protein